MGLKAGLSLLCKAEKTAGRFVLKSRSPINPECLEGLKLATNTVGDLAEFTGKSCLARIKNAIKTYAPLNKQEEALRRYNDFITSETDLSVIEKLFKATEKEFGNISEKELILRYNKLFKNLKTLKENNPKDYDIMVKGKFFDLVEQGKISLCNFNTDFSKARISRSLLEDLRKIADGEDIIRKVDSLKFDEIKS